MTFQYMKTARKESVQALDITMESSADDELLIPPKVVNANISYQKKKSKHLVYVLGIILIAFGTVCGIYLWQRDEIVSRHHCDNKDKEFRLEEIFNVHMRMEDALKIQVLKGGHGDEFLSNTKANPLSSHEALSNLQCDIDGEDNRFDCDPAQTASEDECRKRGCCYVPARTTYRKHNPNVKDSLPGRKLDVPWCFFPKNYNGYVVNEINDTKAGLTVSLSRTTESGWPNDVTKLELDVMMETKSRLHFKIYDPSEKRFEVPLATPKAAFKADNTDYLVKVQDNPFGITVTRKSTGAVLFDSASLNAPLIFADQFIQMSTHTGTGRIYGLGEHQRTFLHSTSWLQLGFWNHDSGPKYDNNFNLYGSHPFFVGLEADGKAYGVFLLNSNAMDVDIQPTPALTFRTIGGILDFYIFTGPTVDEVIQQYTEVIGKPFMPPYWALGFHLCKWGYSTSKELKAVIDRNRAIGIPYDVQWNDIDYMEKRKDWTYDKDTYEGLPDIVQDLHDNNQRYIIITDPGISNVQKPGTYFPYDEGMKRDVFVKNATGQTLIDAQWPGSAVFPDYFHPEADDWWYQCAKRYHDQVPYDGLWIDMNEPAFFKEGSERGCTTNNLDNPPYVPGIDRQLESGTMCPSALQYISTHYNLHNMYGFSEGRSTYRALKKLLNKRSLVISRSNFPGLGAYSGHWSGDIESTWESLYYSIPQMLNYNLYGIPMVGADICGFRLNTTEQLCTRWMQLGAFYPFMRNHASIETMDQDPGVWSKKAQNIMKHALEVRYMLLPYLYTLFYRSHVDGTPVARSLMSQYPTDTETHSIDKQFLWGDGLLISPVLEEDAVTVNAYFPKDRWYDLYTAMEVKDTGTWNKLDAPLDTINVHVRGGIIITSQIAGVNTVETRKNAYVLVIALDRNNSASGNVFIDDGESLDTIQNNEYTYVEYEVKEQKLESKIVESAYRPSGGLVLGLIEIFGVESQPTEVILNGRTPAFRYEADAKLLTIQEFVADLNEPLIMIWK